MPDAVFTAGIDSERISHQVGRIQIGIRVFGIQEVAVVQGGTVRRRIILQAEGITDQRTMGTADQIVVPRITGVGFLIRRVTILEGAFIAKIVTQVAASIFRRTAAVKDFFHAMPGVGATRVRGVP